MRNLAIFIDVGNQYYCINKKWEGRKLNYAKYLNEVKEYGDITRAFAYGTQIEDAAAKFITVLHHLGFEPRYKQVEKNVWFSWGVGIAMDIVRLVSNDRIDTIVLGHSDRSLVPVIEWAREKGVQTIIIGCGINKELKVASDKFVEITEAMLEDQVIKEEEGEEEENEITETTE